MPRLSHQFPVDVTVAVTDDVVDVVEVGLIVDVVEAVVLIDVVIVVEVPVVEAFAVVDEEQDASIIDVTTRNVTMIQIPFLVM